MWRPRPREIVPAKKLMVASNQTCIKPRCQKSFVHRRLAHPRSKNRKDTAIHLPYSQWQANHPTTALVGSNADFEYEES